MRTKKTVLVLLSGFAGSGKTTVKNLLMMMLKRGAMATLTSKEYSFASPLKYMAEAFLGWNKEKDKAGRQLLQNLGRVGREYDQDIWCKHLINQLDKSKEMFPYNFVVVDDWRYPNELEFFKKNPLFDIVTVRVTGRGGLEGEAASDTSETSLPEPSATNTDAVAYFYQHLIDNSGTEDELKLRVESLFTTLKENYIV